MYFSKRYCFAGDDSVSAAVSDIVRGCLCPAIKAVFDHGLLRKSPLLSGPVHPWVFIEEAASKEVHPKQYVMLKDLSWFLFFLRCLNRSLISFRWKEISNLFTAG